MMMRKTRGWALAGGVVLAVSGCMQGGAVSSVEAPDKAVEEKTTTRLVERDVEAPKVFNVSESGLWDGRPSLGGIWVAYPGVKDPERVIIRNPANGKFVIGALFRREREMPGPKLQVSSDAAAALELLAGQPVKLEVTALRREEVAEPVVAPATPVLDQAQTIETENLPSAPKPAAAAATAAAPQDTANVGMFSVEANARSAVETLKKAGIKSEIKPEVSQGKPAWRVVALPAAGQSGQALLAKVKAAGFKDAYFVAR